jgi:hypothetical protein
MNRVDQESELAEALEQALTERASTTAVLDGQIAELLQLARTFEKTAHLIAPSIHFRASRLMKIAHFGVLRLFR